MSMCACRPRQMLANEAAMAVLSLLQLIFTPVLCSVLAYNAVEWNWRSHIFEMWGSASTWGQSLCEQCAARLLAASASASATSASATASATASTTA